MWTCRHRYNVPTIACLPTRIVTSIVIVIRPVNWNVTRHWTTVSKSVHVMTSVQTDAPVATVIIAFVGITSPIQTSLTANTSQKRPIMHAPSTVPLMRCSAIATVAALTTLTSRSVHVSPIVPLDALAPSTSVTLS